MAQQIKMITTNTDDLSLIPKTNMAEENKELLKVLFWPPCVYHGMCMLPNRYTHTVAHTVQKYM